MHNQYLIKTRNFRLASVLTFNSSVTTSEVLKLSVHIIYYFLGKKQFSRLPSEISDIWLESLPLVKPPTDSVHYRDKQLQAIIKQLRSRLDNDDPLEEYKVITTLPIPYL